MLTGKHPALWPSGVVAEEVTAASARPDPPRRAFSRSHHHQIVSMAAMVHERNGRHTATADLAEDSRDVGVGDTPQEAVREAIRSLGEPHASEMAAGVAEERRGSQS